MRGRLVESCRVVSCRVGGPPVEEILHNLDDGAVRGGGRSLQTAADGSGGGLLD